jgi:hypothetical protein
MAAVKPWKGGLIQGSARGRRRRHVRLKMAGLGVGMPMVEEHDVRAIFGARREMAGHDIFAGRGVSGVRRGPKMTERTS